LIATSDCAVLSNGLAIDRQDCFCDGVGEIAGSILTYVDCDITGTGVIITDANGVVLGTPMADSNGNWSLANGPYPCGEYIAMLDPASVPGCYTDAGGDVGPAGFTVGDGGTYGVDFTSFEEVPTLSQWGLMSLALLLMIFGALKLATFNSVQSNRKEV